MITPTTTLEISELVDLDLEPECEHFRHPDGVQSHAGPAAYLVRRDYRCRCARPPKHMLLCAPSYAAADMIRCIHCGEIRPRADVWTIVSVL